MDRSGVFKIPHATKRMRQILQCQYCSNTYQKKEHLTRHERTHTGHRPFVCPKCDRSFARHDSMLRHEKVHTSKGTDTTSEVKCSTWTPLAGQTGVPISQPQNINNQQRVETDTSALALNNTPFFTETEDFFQYLLSTPPGWPTSIPTDVSTESLPGVRNTGNFQTNIQHVDEFSDGSPQAVQQVGALISDMVSGLQSFLAAGHGSDYSDQSSNVTIEINARGITSSFLDACLHQFFARYNPTIQILHEPTFDLKDCGPFLLLNMVAIGSLFFGSTDAVLKGEFLWRLAQTAAATSWGDVFEGKTGAFGPHAAQIVTTALLGQTYAMLSRSRRLRTLCQTLHGPALSWARQFGMLDIKNLPLSEIPDISDSHEVKMEKWKAWVSVEVQRRTVLCLYIIDAQLARYAGAAPVAKHATNPMMFTSNDSVFQAATPDAWINEIRQTWDPPNTFREVYVSMFYPMSFDIPCDSQMSILVMLEGYQAILSEHGDAHGAAVGIPPLAQIIEASLRLRKTYLAPPTMTVETKELLLRWHNFCLDLATDSVLLCQRLCVDFGITQNLFAAGCLPPDPIDLREWANSVEARRALLHAVAIQDLAEDMTLGRAYPVHAPASIFAAATIFCAYSRFGQSSITIPVDPDWDAAWACETTDQQRGVANVGQVDLETSDSHRFVLGNYPSGGKTKTRNLRYSLLTLQMILQMISTQWGISHDMLAILSVWIGAST